MSDHRSICFTLNAKHIEKKVFRNPKRTDKALFQDLLDTGIKECQIPQQTNVESLENCVSNLHSILINSYEKACPLSTINSKNSPWWCNELGKMRTTSRKLFNKAKNSRTEADWLSYQEHKNLYKKAIRQKQRTAWRNYVSNIEATAPVARLKKMFTKEPNQQLGCLKHEDGSYATSITENNEILLKTHFPGCVISQDCPWTDRDHSLFGGSAPSLLGNR